VHGLETLTAELKPPQVTRSAIALNRKQAIDGSRAT
jgi:hypothetical protein